MCLCFQCYISDHCLCYQSQQSPSCPYTYSFSRNFWCFCVFKIHLDAIFGWKARLVCCVCGISLVKPALFSAWIKWVKSTEAVKNSLKKGGRKTKTIAQIRSVPWKNRQVCSHTEGLLRNCLAGQGILLGSCGRSATEINTNPPPSHSKVCGACKTKLSEARYVQRLQRQGKLLGAALPAQAVSESLAMQSWCQ